MQHKQQQASCRQAARYPQPPSTLTSLLAAVRAVFNVRSAQQQRCPSMHSQAQSLLCCCLQNVLYGAGGADFCIYFTNWTFVAFGLTGLLGVAVSARVSGFSG